MITSVYFIVCYHCYRTAPANPRGLGLLDSYVCSIFYYTHTDREPEPNPNFFVTLTCRAHTTFFVDRSLRQVSFFSETMEVRLSSLMRMKHCRLNLLFSLFLLASCANAQLSITEEELMRIIGRSETVKTVTPLSLAANFERIHVRWILIARDVVLRLQCTLFFSRHISPNFFSECFPARERRIQRTCACLLSLILTGRALAPTSLDQVRISP